MCCLFGLIDRHLMLSASEKNNFLRCLSIAAEERGTDATGIAYYSGGHLHIYKRPAAAHKLSLVVPAESRVIMGHTRMTTQGSELKPYNNHPFRGTVPAGRFALAHNGVLRNDAELRKKLKLPSGKIETDSYVAVQLLEKRKALDLGTLAWMAEQIKGSFAFTILDERDNLYFIKGDNPIGIYQLENGVIVYASTRTILEKGLRAAGFAARPRKEINIDTGEILLLSATGEQKRKTFHLPTPLFGSWLAFPPYPKARPSKAPIGDYRQALAGYADVLGIPQMEMEYLSETDLTDTDLELALYNRDFRESCLEIYGYYGEMEDYDDYFGCYGW